mgnify:CR=1 FL=1
MYLIVIAWLYVTVMMAVAEASSPQGSILGAAITFTLYGLLPMSILVYILGTPARKRKLQAQREAEQREQETVQGQTAPVAVEPQVAAAAVEHIVNAPASVETVQSEVVIAEPQATVVETTHPEVIATPVEEQPQIIAESDAPVAEDTAAKAEPVAEIVAAPVVEESAEVVISQPEVAEEIAEVVETAPVAEEVAAPQEVVAAPVVEDTVAKAEVVATRIDAEHLHSHAAAPMTRAPAPEYVPEAPRHSDWQRPEFAFEGKGAAGGHSATHQATAPATRPQPIE